LSKFLFIAGERLPESTHYCYPDWLRTAQFPYPLRNVSELLDNLDVIDQEERRSIRQELSKAVCFKGISILHRINSLYGFDMTKDFVIDLQHGLPLSPVKHEFEVLPAYLEDRHNPERKGMGVCWGRRVVNDISDRLDAMAWTSGACLRERVDTFQGCKRCLLISRAEVIKNPQEFESCWISERYYLKLVLESNEMLYCIHTDTNN
jgi:hypothetical protein